MIADRHTGLGPCRVGSKKLTRVQLCNTVFKISAPQLAHFESRTQRVSVFVDGLSFNNN